MSQGSLNPKIRFLGLKVSPVAHLRTDTQTHMKVTTEGTLSGFQEFFLQPVIKDRPNMWSYLTYVFRSFFFWHPSLILDHGEYLGFIYHS